MVWFYNLFSCLNLQFERTFSDKPFYPVFFFYPHKFLRVRPLPPPVLGGVGWGKGDRCSGFPPPDRETRAGAHRRCQGRGGGDRGTTPRMRAGWRCRGGRPIGGCTPQRSWAAATGGAPGFGVREGARKVDCLGAPTAACFHRDNHQPAPPVLGKLRVGGGALSGSGALMGIAGDRGGVMAGFAVAPDRASQGSVNCQLGTVPQGEPLRQYFDLASVSDWWGQIHVAEGHVDADPGPGLPEDAG